MNIKKALAREHSKENTLIIVKVIENNPQKFDELMEIFFKGDYRLTQRASWVISYFAEKNPEFIIPYLQQMLKFLEGNVHNAVKRNILRILQFITIPEELLGTAAEISYNLMTSRKEPVAIKTFAMTVLFNISQREPELKRELKILIEDLLPYESAAFTSRGKKFLKKLDKV